MIQSETSLLKNKRPGTSDTRTVGAKGEDLAAEFLAGNGYRLVISNFKAPVGRNANGAEITGEIDLIALDVETLCFIEVKTRVIDDVASPLIAVTLRKQRQITRTAKIYRRMFAVTEMPYRYDVVSIVLGYVSEPTIELHKGFWDESKFKKRTWNFEAWD